MNSAQTNGGFAELAETALIAAEGADAVAFLHAQLTSDVAGLADDRTQYSGHCSPKGRLLATFLVWKERDRIFLQLPRALREAVQARLAKYILRSKVSLTDGTAAHALFGVWGEHAHAALESLGVAVPAGTHEIAAAPGLAAAKLAHERYLVRASAAQAAAVRAALAKHAPERAALEWSRLDIEAGIPVITPATQDEYVPQMVNLDLIGGVSYSKGCYPGQEIVARMHYLGRLKQRTYRVHVAASEPAVPGDPLYSEAFGDQASGAILNAVPAPGGGSDALAVIQTAAADSVHWRALDGPAVALKPLPYALPG